MTQVLRASQGIRCFRNTAEGLKRSCRFLTCTNVYTRNFSNRTKTGCLTCRERKKKCDESRPICSNCERGGFHCKGYAHANGVIGPNASREQLQVRTKTDYSNTVDPIAQLPQAISPAEWHYRTLAEGSRVTPNDEESPQQPLTPSSSTRQERRSPAAQTSFPRPLSRTSNLSAPRLAVLHDVRYPGSNYFKPPTPLHPPHEQSTKSMNPFDIPRNTTQMASEQSSYQASQPALCGTTQAVSRVMSERDKMLLGLPFRADSAQLKRDRQDCLAAVQGYNQAATHFDPVSDSQGRDYLRRIMEGPIQAGLDLIISPASTVSSSGSHTATPLTQDPCVPSGRLGVNVEISAPFFCDYGYNLRIGNDVEIGANCRIIDAATVEIGARTIIEADVKIITTEADFEGALAMPGEKRLLRSRKVVIEEDCYIGAGSLIPPGTTIARGTVIPPGTIISKVSGTTNVV